MYDVRIVERALQLSRQGFTDRETARMCGVSVGAVRKWRYGTRRAPYDPTRPRSNNERGNRDCPRCFDCKLDRRAYSYLLGTYLGDGHIVAISGGRRYRLSVSCSTNWPGLVEDVAGAMAAVLPQTSVLRRERNGAVEVFSQSKHWPCLFPQHGPGMKHTRRIELSWWQQEITSEYTEDFIRGLLHSDGCRVINRVRHPSNEGERWYEYPRYLFTNASDDIRTIYTDALDRLGIAWKQNKPREISVARREAVARLDEFVGPKY